MEIRQRTHTNTVYAVIHKEIGIAQSERRPRAIVSCSELRAARKPAQLQMTQGDGWRELKKERKDVSLCSSAYTTGCSAWLHI